MLAVTQAVASVYTLLDTLVDMAADALVDTLADKVAEEKDGTLGERLRNVVKPLAAK